MIITIDLPDEIHRQLAKQAQLHDATIAEAIAQFELRPQYDMKELLKGGVRGQYVARYRAGSNVIVLAPDVAQAVPTEEAVHEALRLVVRMAQIPHLSPTG